MNHTNLGRSRPISATIFVGNLSYETTEDELRALLSEIDPRVRVRLGVDRMTGRARGFAFAEFSDATLAADAIRRVDGVDLRGRRLRVNDADDKPPPRAPRPPQLNQGGPAPRFAAEAMPPPPEDFREFRKQGGSRRGLRARKRSLRYS